MSWRTGRKLGRTIYDGDVLIGIMDRAEDAELIVRQREHVRTLRAAMERQIQGLLNILEFRKLSGESQRYGALTREELEQSISEGRAALEATKEIG